jgi:hypothetical protein
MHVGIHDIIQAIDPSEDEIIEMELPTVLTALKSP